MSKARRRLKAEAIDKKIGALMKKARDKFGRSLAEIEKRAGVSAQQIAKYEAGLDRVRAAMLHKLAGIYGVDVREMFP